MHALAFSLVMLAGPTVAVDVRLEDNAEADALQSWLSVQLLQEGYDLGPSETRADAHVLVLPRPGGLQVEATGSRGRRSWAVEDGPAPVRRLEVLHRALMGIEATSDPDVPLPRGAALVVRFEGAADEAMLGAITQAARSRGIMLAASAEPGDTLMCVAARGELAEVGLGPVEDGCAPSSMVVSRKPEVASTAAAEIVEVVAPDLAPPLADSEAPMVLPAAPVDHEIPVPHVARDDDDPVAMVGAPRAEARFGVDGGIVVRGAVDAAMRVFTRLGKYEGFGGHLELGVIPSGGVSVRVVDTVLGVGPDWQIDLRPRLRLSLGATVGADVQTFVISDSTAADVGWVVTAPVELSVRLRRETRLHVVANAGMSGVGRSHRLGDETMWERSPWRVGIALGFSNGWRIE